MIAPLLELTEVVRHFGGVKAVDGVSFAVQPAIITALIGPNGAGKTTMINLITGVQIPSDGKITFNALEINALSIHDRANMGLARTYQTPQMISDLSAFENVLVGADIRSRFHFRDVLVRPWRVRSDNMRSAEKASAALRRVDLVPELWPCAADDLSYGDQRKVEIARALAQDPALLLLDEPAAGLNPIETGKLGQLLAEIASGGIAILLVEHDMSLVMSRAHHVVVVDFGRKLSEGSPADISSDEKVISAYLGADLDYLGGPAEH